MPILVRPVREQLEHDRVIRQLQAKWRRRYGVAVNLGAEQTASVRAGGMTLHPDLILTPASGGRRVEAIVEVETGESVNSMEALAQWAPMGRFRAPFHLYVPSGSVEAVRRLCADHAIPVAEIWSYHAIGDQMRFSLVHRGSRPAAEVRPKAAAPRRGGKATKARAKRPGRGRGSKASKVPARRKGRAVRRA